MTTPPADQFFLLVMGMIVFLMQAGFAFLEAGSVRSKNTSNILIKNLLDQFVAGISYWLVGYAFAFGDGNAFIGYSNWAIHDIQPHLYAYFFFQFVFAATAATIVSGSLAERCQFGAYFVYSFVVTGFVYPVVTHWCWNSQGWLAKGDVYDISGVNVTISYMDFAGSGVVHCVGGSAAFVGCCIIGPRIGRFHKETGTAVPIRGHSTPFAALGGFILLFGFMAFNGGSQAAISSPGDAETVALAVVNTVISGSMAAFFTLALQRMPCGSSHKWSLLSTINGGLAGMVAICAGCNVIKPWGACCVGVVAGVAYNFTSWLMVKMRVDDPLDAVAVHFGGGFWGVVSVALFKYDDGVLFQWDKKAGLMLSWQLAGVAAITGWTVVICAAMFAAMRITGFLRVSAELEKKGLDIPKHGEPAYPLEAYGHGYLERIITILENGQLQQAEMGNLRSFVNGAYKGDGEHFEHAEVLAMEHKRKLRHGGGPPSPERQSRRSQRQDNTRM